MAAEAVHQEQGSGKLTLKEAEEQELLRKQRLEKREKERDMMRQNLVCSGNRACGYEWSSPLVSVSSDRTLFCSMGSGFCAGAADNLGGGEPPERVPQEDDVSQAKCVCTASSTSAFVLSWSGWHLLGHGGRLW